MNESGEYTGLDDKVRELAKKLPETVREEFIQTIQTNDFYITLNKFVKGEPLSLGEGLGLPLNLTRKYVPSEWLNLLEWADVVKFEGKFFRKEQILSSKVEGKVNIIINKCSQIIEISRTQRTITLEAEVAYLDDIFRVVRAFSPDIDGDNLKCSICGEINTSGYFVERIKSEPLDTIYQKELVFVGYMCWKSNLRPKL